MKRKLFLFIYLFQFVCLTANAGNVFQQGSMTATIALGSGQAYGQDYTIFGAGASYYLFDGFSVGMDYETWTGGTPSINKLSPRVQYVFVSQQSISPYAGLFFTRTSVTGLDNIDSSGYNLGVYFDADRDLYFGLGYVFEHYDDCSQVVNCNDTYPEITLAIAF